MTASVGIRASRRVSRKDHKATWNTFIALVLALGAGILVGRSTSGRYKNATGVFSSVLFRVPELDVVLIESH